MKMNDEEWFDQKKHSEKWGYHLCEKMSFRRKSKILVKTVAASPARDVAVSRYGARLLAIFRIEKNKTKKNKKRKV